MLWRCTCVIGVALLLSLPLCAQTTVQGGVILQGGQGSPGPVGPQGVPGPPGGSLSYPGVVSDGANGMNVTGNVAATTTNNIINPVQGYGADPTGSADSTTAINNACSAANAGNYAVKLPPGTYKVTSTLTNCGPNPITFLGSGVAKTIINWGGTTGYVFPVTYSAAGAGTKYTIAAQFSDFQINQATGITPTAGGGFLVGSGSSNPYTIGLRIQNITMNNLFAGIKTQDGMISNWFDHIYCNTMASGGGGCIDYASSSPSGDNHWNDIEANGPNTGITIERSDTQEFSHIKLNGSGLSFTGVALTENVRFVDPSIEGAMSCAVSFSGAAIIKNISIVGGEMNQQPTANVCNTATSATYSWSNSIDLTASNTSGSPIHDISGKVATQYFTSIQGNCTGLSPLSTSACAWMQVGSIANKANGIMFGPVSDSTAAANQATSWIGSLGNGNHSNDLRFFTAFVGTGTQNASNAFQSFLLRTGSDNAHGWGYMNGSLSLGTGAGAQTDPGNGNFYATGDITAAGQFHGDGSLLTGLGWIGSTPTGTCAPGQYAGDSTHIYLCIAANTWVASTAASYTVPAQLNDTFTGTSGTNITAHTSDTGQTWTYLDTTFATTSGDLLLNGSNVVRNTNATTTNYEGAYSSLVPASANYIVSSTAAEANIVSQLATYGRMNVASHNAYDCVYTGNTGIQLFKIVGGTATQLGTTAAGNWANGVNHTVSLVMNGANISCQLDGTTVVGPVTDSSITAAGTVAFRLNGISYMALSGFKVQ